MRGLGAASLPVLSTNTIDVDSGAFWPGGRLIVSPPIEDCVPHRNHVRVCRRPGLEAELRPFGEPVLVTEQPYKWLPIYVDRGS